MWCGTVWKLEEAVRDSTAEVQSGTSGTARESPPPTQTVQGMSSPGRTTAEAVSIDNQCNYIVYTMRDHAHNVVAVLIETKMTHHSKCIHAIAQVTSVKSS